MFSNIFSILSVSPDAASVLDTKLSATVAYKWHDIATLQIDDPRKQLTITFSGGGASSIGIPLDNITFIYRSDGVCVDRFVHPGVDENKINMDAVFGFRVAGGAAAAASSTVVNHLGSYVADVPVILMSRRGASSSSATNSPTTPVAAAAAAATASTSAAIPIFELLEALAPKLSKLHDPAIPRPPGSIQYQSAPTEAPGFFKTLARTLVSRAKRRFTEGNFNLDLAYITANVIAMGYPTPTAESESSYRNDMGDVFRFFSTRHCEKYWVINLCSERAFPPSAFCGRFSRLPFEDHEAPPVALLFAFCQCIELFLATGRPMLASANSNALAPFLTADERAAFWNKCPPCVALSPTADDLPAAEGRVVAVHCKAGKGRTGVSLSAWIFYSRLMRAMHAAPRPGQPAGMPPPNAVIPNVEECAQLFGLRRSNDGSGVTIVSQMRYMRYFSRCCCELGMRLPPTIRSVRVVSVTVNQTPALDGKGGCKPFVIVRVLRSPQIWEKAGRREWLGRGMKVSAAPQVRAPMTPRDQCTLQTVADSRLISAPEWVVAGSRVVLPLGNVHVEDEFHISVWHQPGSAAESASSAKKRKRGAETDADDDDFDAAAAEATGGPGEVATIAHGAKGEFMACACWLHASFLEIQDPPQRSPDDDDTLETTTFSLGLRQLDGCSKGKSIELFEDNFTIDIEVAGCHPRPRPGNLPIPIQRVSREGSGGKAREQ